MENSKLIARAQTVIQTELVAIAKLAERIDNNFIQACELILECKGRVIVTGMGKSGHIACKIAATLASTGTPAFFVHPGEASHGDMGMILAEDVVLVISNSGTTPEILTLLPYLDHLKIPLISLTKPGSTIAKAAKINLNVSVEKEACPLDLAPTASTSVALVMGDALAMSLLEARGFTRENFALAHPSGALGKRLLLQVFHLMHQGSEVPIVTTEATLSETLVEITQKKLGMTTVVNDRKELQGIFTDGDLRRSLAHNIDIHTAKLVDFMTKNPRTILANSLAIDALNLMEERKITNLAVVDENNIVQGVLHMHDLLQAGIV
jgi:arabinose-5-phosphate isomerase